MDDESKGRVQIIKSAKMAKSQSCQTGCLIKLGKPRHYKLQLLLKDINQVRVILIQSCIYREPILPISKKIEQ